MSKRILEYKIWTKLDMFFRMLFYIFLQYLGWIAVLKIVKLKGCNSETRWLETRKLFVSKCFRLATLSFWTPPSWQLFGSQLANRWFATSNLLTCTLLVLVTLSCGFSSAQSFHYYHYLMWNKWYHSIVDYSVVNADRIFTIFFRNVFRAIQIRLLEIML